MKVMKMPKIVEKYREKAKIEAKLVEIALKIEKTLVVYDRCEEDACFNSELASDLHALAWQYQAIQGVQCTGQPSAEGKSS